MTIEDFSKHKKRKDKNTTSNMSWLKSVYNPKMFRRKVKEPVSQTSENEEYEHKVMTYIAILVVVMLFILAFAILKKYGLVD